MSYKALLSFLFLAINSAASAHWEKINDVDYTWGPFKIYNISLFTENGEYKNNSRPVMLTLKYSKPVDGRDFAISVAKSWSDLGLKLQNQNEVIDRLRKTLPDLKPDDSLSYIALEDRGYFVLNDEVIPQEFDREFNDAMLAVWLDPKMDISRQLTTKKVEGTAQEVHYSDDYTPHNKVEEKVAENSEVKDIPASTEQAVDAVAVATESETKSEPVKEKATTNAKPAEQPAATAAKVEETKAGKTEEKAAETKTTEKTAIETKSEATPAPEAAKTDVKVDDANADKAKTDNAKAEEATAPQATPAEQAKPAEKPAEEQKKEETENPEKIIIPEMDPTPSNKQPLS